MAVQDKYAILFLCTGNSCRSQMTEGWVRTIHSDIYGVYSAGIEAHDLDPRAIEVMQEAGVDISAQRSQRLEELSGLSFDAVITVCSSADKNCPTLPASCLKLNVPFDDPPALARNDSNDEDALRHYRRVRDEIRGFVEGLPERLASERQS